MIKYISKVNCLKLCPSINIFKQKLKILSLILFREIWALATKDSLRKKSLKTWTCFDNKSDFLFKPMNEKGNFKIVVKKKMLAFSLKERTKRMKWKKRKKQRRCCFDGCLNKLRMTAAAFLGRSSFWMLLVSLLLTLEANGH